MNAGYNQTEPVVCIVIRLCFMTIGQKVTEYIEISLSALFLN